MFQTKGRKEGRERNEGGREGGKEKGSAKTRGCKTKIEILELRNTIAEISPWVNSTVFGNYRFI
jgi:hypothetical protein